MTKIFISYRRQDSKPIATLIYRPLAQKFGAGDVFLDVHGIPKGLDFYDYLNEQVSKAEVLLAIIADRWLTAADERGRRRLDEEEDFVRIEIEAALKRGIPVIPLYVDGARPVRSEDLPDCLKSLARRNGAFLDTGVDFDLHIARLIQDIELHLYGSLRQPHPTPPDRFISKSKTPLLARTFEGHEDRVLTAEFSPDGNSLISGSADTSVKLWDVNGGGLIRTLKGHTEPVGATFSPDGRMVVSHSADSTLKIWEIGTGKLVHTLLGHQNAVLGAAFSPDGSILVSGSWDKTLKMWSTQNGKLLSSLNNTQPVLAVAFSPDGKTVVSGGWEKALQLWEHRSGSRTRQLKGHLDSVTDVAFSADGTMLASASMDQTLRLWEARTGKLIRVIDAHQDGVSAASFSPDGKTLVSGSHDQTLAIWEVSSGKLKFALDAHTDTVTAAAFSGDGKALVSGSWDQTLKLWDLSDLA